MQWQGPILTDSGGFQVYSLGQMRTILEAGVIFRSPINGDTLFLGPEQSIAFQHALGADIVMVFDECTSYPASEAQAAASMEPSLRWAARCRTVHDDSPAALFGIVQGGLYPHLRKHSLAGLLAIGFDGYAIGGLSVGEPAAFFTPFRVCKRFRLRAAYAALRPGARPASRCHPGSDGGNWCPARR